MSTAQTNGDVEVMSDFREGMRFFQVGNYDVAIEFFKEVCDNVGVDDENYNKYRSWLGVSQAMTGDEGGVVLCRLAANGEERDAYVLLNLAKAELARGDRTKALRALERGLAVEASHKGLIEMMERLDRRRRPAIPFLSRNNVLNKLIGKYSYRLSRGKFKKVPAQQ